jgi:hypothetical protein
MPILILAIQVGFMVWFTYIVVREVWAIVQPLTVPIVWFWKKVKAQCQLWMLHHHQKPHSGA